MECNCPKIASWGTPHIILDNPVTQFYHLSHISCVTYGLTANFVTKTDFFLSLLMPDFLNKI